MTATKAPAKTIFEKTYMVVSQAEKAAAKEFGDNWAADYVVVEAGKRFAVAAKPTLVAPQAAAQAVLDKALVALASIEKVAHDVVENFTLAQAMAESGETLADLKDDAPKAKYTPGTGRSGCGFDNCPGCGIDLDNGVIDWNSVVELHGSKAREHQQHEWACLGCGAEWGPKRAGITIQKDRAEQNGVVRPSEGGVCASIWAECDSRSQDGNVPPVKDMKAWALANGVDQTTCLIQYYQWRKFMGVRGREKTLPAK